MFNATEYFIWSIWLVPTNKRLPQNGRTSFPRGEAANLSLARGLSQVAQSFSFPLLRTALPPTMIVNVL
jgi:hypothetical protein